MYEQLQAVDYAALSPLLIILGASLIILLLEAFSVSSSRILSFYITVFAIVGAFVAALISPKSQNPLLTPWLVFDSFSRFFTLLFLLIGLASAFLTATFFERINATRGEYYFLLLASIFGLILIAAAADFLTLFLGLETLSIALYVLCGYVKRWEVSSEAAVKYFLIGSIAAAFLLYGIALIYGATGFTHFQGLLDSYRSITDNTKSELFFGGVALVTLGLAFKAAVVPFHVWAPDVYDGAPNPVTAFMAVGTKVGAFAALARLFIMTIPQFDTLWNQGVSWLAILTMVFANFVALRQVQMRRFFAYSGISHAGFLLIPIIAETAESLPALEFYLVVYSIATLGAFAVLAILDRDSKGVYLNDLRGLFERSPWWASVLTLSLLTLAGIPPTAGFFAKFYVLKLAFQSGYIVLAIVGLLTTILSAFYYLRIVSIIFSESSEEERVSHSWPATVVGIAVFAGILLFSIYPDALFTILPS